MQRVMILRQLKISEETFNPFLVLYRRGRLDLLDEESPLIQYDNSYSGIFTPRIISKFADG